MNCSKLLQRNFLALMIGLASAPVGAYAANSQEIRAVLQSEPTTLDPHSSTQYSARTFGYLIYDTLFGMDTSGKSRPQMLEKVDISDDKLLYTFTLRSGLKWHDGGDVTSADCIASIKRWEPKSALGRRLLAASDGIVAVDARTFRLKLKKPFPLVAEALGQPNPPVAFMMPERVIKAAGDGRVTTFVGSGPFVFKSDEYRPGDQIVVEKNKAYVPRAEASDFLAGGKTVHIDRLVLKVISDGATAVNALNAEEIDYLESPATDLLPILESNSKIAVVHLSGLDTYQGNLRPNFTQPPFNDPAIRRVLFKAMDQTSTLQAVGLPAGFMVPRCRSFFECGTPLETTQGIEVIGEPSIPEAKAELAKTAYKGETVVILQPTDIEMLKVAAEIAADRLQQAGFKVDLQATDWGTVAARRAKREGWNIFPTTSSGFDISSPLTHFAFQANCTDFAGWSCSQRLAAAMDKFAEADTPEARKKTAGDIAAIAYEEVPAVPFGQYSQAYAWNKKLKNVIRSSIPVFWTMGL